MAKKYPPCGKYGCKLGWLVGFFNQVLGVSYETKIGKGVFGKELEILLNEINIVAPENLINGPHGCPLTETQAIRLVETLAAEQEFWNK